VKNKVTVPYQDCEFKLMYNEGLTRDYGLTSSAYKNGLVSMPSKGWYSLDGEAKFRAAELTKTLAEMIEEDSLK